MDNALQSNDAYQFYRILHIEGDIDVQMLSQAINQIVARHTVLRTTYHDTQNGSVQRVADGTDFNLDYLDLAGAGQGALAAKINDTAGQFKQTVFDLSNQLMIKALLLKTESARYQLHIKFHHIATDGWSIGLIVKELTELYTHLNNRMINESSAEQDMPLQYIDYAHWQQSDSSKQTIANNLSFYKTYLEGAPELHGLPVDNTQRAGMDKTVFIPRKLSQKTVRALKSFCQSENVTAFSFLQLCLSILISLPLGFALTSSRHVSNAIYPLLVLTQSIPKVALAPILVIAMGANELPRVAVTFLVAFFPLVIAIATGLLSVPA
ncbi:MAG: condensation domain-containing protein, partial [Psychrosphaera sp.]|nr:condensation domain-containing protein [Psychrosphaera sp.]